LIDALYLIEVALDDIQHLLNIAVADITMHHHLCGVEQLYQYAVLL
jgi:hypothetical protein